MRQRKLNEPVEWRATTGAQVLVVTWIVVCAVPVVAMAYFAAVEGDLAGTLMFVGALVVGGAVALGCVLRAKVVCEPNELVVLNLLRERRINWGAIARAEPGYYGLVIHLKDGGRVTAIAVQKANVTRLLGRHTRSDDLVDVINRRVGRRRV